MARPIAGYANASGKKIPGSTTVLKSVALMDTDILCAWAAKLARLGKNWKTERANAGKHGTLLHELCETRLPHALDPVKDRPVQLTLPPPPLTIDPVRVEKWKADCLALDTQWSNLQQSYAAIREWYQLYQPTVIFGEEPLVSEQYGFAGTPDAAWTFPKDTTFESIDGPIVAYAGDPWLGDYKTGGIIGAKEIAQMASYRQLLREARGIDVKGCVLIHAPTKEPGYMRPVVLPPAALDIGWDIFISGLTVHHAAPRAAAYTEV